MLSRTSATIGFILMLLAQNLFAGSGLLFKIATSGNPASINITLCLDASGPLSCQNYDVSASSLAIITTIPNHSYSNAGIKVNTPGYIITLGNSQACTLNSNGYCSFSVSNTSPAIIHLQSTTLFTIGGTITGLTSNGLVLQNNGSDNLSVNANASNFTFSQAIPRGTSYHVTVLSQPTFQTCTVTNGTGTDVTTNIDSVTVTCNTTYLYAVNFPASATDFSIAICPVSQDGSSLGVCTETTAPDSTGNTALGQADAIALNPAKTKAYIGNLVPLTGPNACPNSESSIAICPINSDGSLATCTTACDPAFLFGITGLAFSPDGQYLYASNVNIVSSCGGMGQPPCGWVSTCPVNPDGTLAPCTTTYGTRADAINFYSDLFIGVQTASNGSTYLYTGANDASLTIAMCLLTDDILSISDCQQTNFATTNIQSPEGISFNAANTVAYIGNNSYVSICPLTNGIITSCDTYNDSSFNFSLGNGVGLIMSSPTGYGYIPNSGSNTLSFCQISPSDGSLSNCIAQQGLNNLGQNIFNGPTALALKMGE